MRQPVSAAEAAALAKAYPAHAAEASRATRGDLVVTTKHIPDGQGGGKSVLLSRHRKFYLPSGQVLTIAEIEPPPAPPPANQLQPPPPESPAPVHVPAEGPQASAGEAKTTGKGSKAQEKG